MNYKTTYESPIGTMTLASDGEKLTGLWNEGQKYHGDAIFTDMAQKDGLPIFTRTKEWLTRYFAGKKPGLSELPLAPSGGEFRQRVWHVLCEIPYGQVVTYGDIANNTAVKAGKSRMSCQAVGNAVGHNPISIIIPCHRVVGVNGNLTGYAGGLAIKAKLLELEGADMTRFFAPEKGTAL